MKNNRAPARRVRDLLRLAIADLHFTGVTGDRGLLPSEAELMLEFDASRTAVREALGLLCEEGLIARRRGLGTSRIASYYVLYLALPGPNPSPEYRILTSRIVPRILGWTWMPTPHVVARRLDGVRAADPCLAIEYILQRDGVPTAVITNYVRRDEALKLSPSSFTSTFYSLLVDEGILLAEQQVTVQPQLADAHLARLLNVEPGSPVSSFEQIIHTNEGEAFDLALGAWRGDVQITGSGLKEQRPEVSARRG